MNDDGDGSSSGDSGYFRQEDVPTIIKRRFAFRAPRNEPFVLRRSQSLGDLAEDFIDIGLMEDSRSSSDGNLGSGFRERHPEHRRAWSQDFAGDNFLDLGHISPIGEERVFRSYSSSRASSVVNIIVGYPEDEEVFYEDIDPDPILNERLRMNNLLDYFNLACHFWGLIQKGYYIESIDFLFNMTRACLLALGITSMVHIAIFTKVMPPYFKDPDSS